LICSPALGFGQQPASTQDSGAKQDMKNAGTDTKNATKDAANGTKKGNFARPFIAVSRRSCRPKIDEL